MDSEVIQRLVVALEGRMTNYERALAKAQAGTTRTFSNIKRQGLDMERAMGRIGLQFGAMFASAAAIRSATRLMDTSTRITNALKVAGLEGQKLDTVYGRLFDSAQKNAAPLESLVTLYGRVSLVQNELGASTEEMLKFTDNVALALRVAGTDAQSASGALLQLSQAMGSGTVRAEEFNSILEGALPIAQAAAAGLDEAGGSVAKLRQLVVDGKVSSEAFFRAFEAGSVILEDKVAGAELTTSQAFVRLQNVLIDAAGKIDDTTGASDGLASAINELAGYVEAIGNYFEDNAEPIRNFFTAISDGWNKLEEMKAGFRSAIGLDVLDDFLEGTSLIEGKFGLASQQFSTQPTGPQGRGGRRPSSEPAEIVVRGGSTVKPVSLADYSVTSDKNAAAAKKERQAVVDLIADLEFERSLVGKSEAQKRALEMVRRAGAAATEDEKAQIVALVGVIETETSALDRLQESLDDAKGLAKDFASGLISDLMQGTSAAEALGNAFGRLGERLMQMALDQAINALFQNLAGAALGSIGGGAAIPAAGFIPGLTGPKLFDVGGYTGAGSRMKPAGIVHAGEYVFSAPAVQRAGIAQLDALHGHLRGFADGGYVGRRLPEPARMMTPERHQARNGDKIEINISGSRQDAAAIARATEAVVHRVITQRQMDPYRR